jgi:hypothetical protein
MKEIRLSNSDKVALVDDEDFDRVCEHKWYIHKDSRTDYFQVKRTTGNVRLHRFILGLGKTVKVVDHIDRNTLNNQRSNLRLVTQRENVLNSNRRKNVLNSNRRKNCLTYILVRKTKASTYKVYSESIEIDKTYYGTYALYDEAILARDKLMVKTFGASCVYLVNDSYTVLNSLDPTPLNRGSSSIKLKGIAQPQNQRFVRPSKEELHKMVWNESSAVIAKRIGCSDKSIEKWCKAYNISKPPKGFWQKVEANKLCNQTCPLL